MAHRIDRPAPPAEPAAATASRRQQLLQLLAQRAFGFEELRRALVVSKPQLEDDLRHLERSLRRGERRLVIEPATCTDCGFVFRGREARHFHPPGRCPRCRAERIEEARLHVPGPA